MNKSLFNLFVLFTFLVLILPAQANENCNQNPAQCTTLNDVRNNIDAIDAQMVELIGKRLAYVKRAGEIKSGTLPVHDQTRENKILARVGLLAEKQGYPATIAQAVYKTLLQQANFYEAQFHISPIEKTTNSNSLKN